MAAMGELWTNIGISPDGALGVAVASALLYILYSVVLTLWGPRLFSSSSTLSVALLTVLGSLVARAMLGEFPTLGGALVAATTLLVMEAVIGRLRRFSKPAWARRGPRPKPRGGMSAGRVVDRPQRERVTTDADVLLRLRTAGVRHVDDAALVILESRGGVTVLRSGERIDARLLADVMGADLVPEHLSDARGAESEPSAS